jgi:hypothetical protein
MVFALALPCAQAKKRRAFGGGKARRSSVISGEEAIHLTEIQPASAILVA